MGGAARSSVSSKGHCKNSRTGKQLTGSYHKLSNESYALQFPGALPVKQTVFARYIAGQWRQASIVHCRPSSTTPSQLSQSPRIGSNYAIPPFQLQTDIPLTTNTSSSASSVSATPSVSTVSSADAASVSSQPVFTSRPSSKEYDYYVHWTKMDRRLDRWLPWSDICSLDEAIPVEDQLILPQDLLSDESHHAEMDEEYLREHEEMTKVKTINSMLMGDHYVDSWYFSPYPKEYQNIECLYICEFCLSFFKYHSELKFHSQRCKIKHPPGTEIFRDTKLAIAMWEIDGCLCRVYTENLCFLSKLFLDHKTLRHPVHLFLFYVMTEIRPTGYHIVGYFSKEKYSNNNLSCILTLPQHQRKGVGKFLINFSYLLSQKERKRGTPERPLSDLGLAVYLSYWTVKVLDSLKKKQTATVEEIADSTYMQVADVATCIRASELIQRHPQTNEQFIFLPQEVETELRKRCGKPPPIINEDLLRWQPYDQFVAPFEFNPNCQ